MNKIGFFVNTYGLDGLKTYFNVLGKNDKAKLIMGAFRKATKPTIQMAQDFAPYRTGKLTKSIGFVPLKEQMPVASVVGARIRRGFKGYAAHLVEDGTRERFHKNGTSTGNVKGTHFFQYAVDQTQDQAIKMVADEWYKGIARYIIRKNKDR